MVRARSPSAVEVHLNDPELGEIQRLYGITYRRTLGEIIELNTGIDVQDNVFEVAPE